jgi:hypothetical protein
VTEWKHDTLDFLLTVPPTLCVPSEIRSRFPEMCKCSSALKMEAEAFCETLVAVHQNYMASHFRMPYFWQQRWSLRHHIRNYFVFVGVRYRLQTRCMTWPHNDKGMLCFFLISAFLLFCTSNSSYFLLGGISNLLFCRKITLTYNIIEVSIYLVYFSWSLCFWDMLT